jgi:type IV pilus assembly protein PilM
MMFRKRLSFGIDMGTYSLKCAVVDYESGSLSESWIVETVPDRQTRDQQASQEALCPHLCDIVKKVQKENPNIERNINTSIEDQSCVTRYLELPPLKPKELSPAVSSQVVKHIPFPMEKAIISFIQVPQLAKTDNVKKTSVFFIAEQSDVMKNLKTRLVDAGCSINRIETPVLAMARVFAKNHSFPKEQFFALVHVGFTLTYVVVVRDRYPYFARNFAIAGRDFTYAFQMGLIKPWGESEEFKRRYDVMEKEVGLEPHMIRWLDEVKKSLDFFARQVASKPLPIERIYMTGGTALLKNLDTRLAEHVGLPVQRDTWDRVKIKGKTQEYCLFNIAIGLGLEP